jgi:hypothetical protein
VRNNHVPDSEESASESPINFDCGLPPRHFNRSHAFGSFAAEVGNLECDYSSFVLLRPKHNPRSLPWRLRFRIILDATGHWLRPVSGRHVKQPQ